MVIAQVKDAHIAGLNRFMLSVSFPFNNKITKLQSVLEFRRIVSRIHAWGRWCSGHRLHWRWVRHWETARPEAKRQRPGNRRRDSPRLGRQADFEDEPNMDTQTHAASDDSDDFSIETDTFNVGTQEDQRPVGPPMPVYDRDEWRFRRPRRTLQRVISGTVITVVRIATI